MGKEKETRKRNKLASNRTMKMFLLGVDQEADEIERLLPPDERAAPDYDSPQSLLDFLDYFGD